MEIAGNDCKWLKNGLIKDNDNDDYNNYDKGIEDDDDKVEDGDNDYN